MIGYKQNLLSMSQDIDILLSTGGVLSKFVADKSVRSR